jgi:transcription-repair coupling factor (superfamily II helicase)
VVILTPTTILAQQHYDNFKDRFADFPITIDLISRFRSSKDQKNILDKLENGKIDIIIGTHKLLQPSVRFKDLGLIIIDEEHRFGVKQKEKLKQLRPNVDVLTLTATPIPRTLNMAFSGIRDFSIISTPPLRRLSIKTFVHERDENLIREAILREVLRGGQVYFLHNFVTTIEKVANELQKLIPTLKVAIAHGQMREHQLERIMSDFYHLRYNVLVCTTIIESGIDIPTANTIIIDNADRFGLAQLHQLRGRVGRSHHQAYSYLLIKSKKSLTVDAKKRLEAITSMEHLGAGFSLATYDLEIRGAGEFLGEEQSGQIESIGFSLYMEYLDKAIKALKNGIAPDLDVQSFNITEIDLQIPALIPDKYLNDVNARLTFYKRMANAKSKETLSELQEELIDRFGLLPEAVKNLFKVTELKLLAEKIGVRKINASKTTGTIEFVKNPHIDPNKIIKLVQKHPGLYKIKGSNKLEFKGFNNEANKKIEFVKELILEIS